MFVYKSNEQEHPTTLAAIMTSTSKENNDYQYMARCLKSEGVDSLVYGMDGECAMEMGFEDVFPIKEGQNVHLRCFDHVHSDMNHKLISIKVDDVQRKNILTDILGKEHDGIREMGLVDCETEDEFEQGYVNMEQRWPQEFREWMLTTKGRVRSLKDTLKVCMLKTVRTTAGLGDPPNKWSNQRTEAMNNVIKEANNNQISDQVTIHEVIEGQVIKQQQNEYIKASYNTGEYRLAQQYKRYSVSPLEWSQKTEEQKKEHVKRVLGSNIDPGSSAQKEQLVRRISVSIANSKLDTIAPGLLNKIWHEAEVILSHHQIINLNNDVYCITEHGNSTNVSTKNGNFICHCNNAKSTSGLCQHTLALAEEKGCLHTFLSKFYSKKNKATNIVKDNAPKRAGEKPKEKKKRKGQNNVESVPIVIKRRKADDEIDFQKPMMFSEIWHNKNPFNIVFTREEGKKSIKCESCTVEFPQGPLICIPQDVAVKHMERYLYPKKDEKGNLIKMVPTWQKEAARFYCIRKACLLQRHPYFWKGMLRVDEHVRSRLKQGHLKVLEELHFTS